jgi:hypothetical protein
MASTGIEPPPSEADDRELPGALSAGRSSPWSFVLSQTAIDSSWSYLSSEPTTTRAMNTPSQDSESSQPRLSTPGSGQASRVMNTPSHDSESLQQTSSTGPSGQADQDHRTQTELNGIIYTGQVLASEHLDDVEAVFDSLDPEAALNHKLSWMLPGDDFQAGEFSEAQMGFDSLELNIHIPGQPSNDQQLGSLADDNAIPPTLYAPFDCLSTLEAGGLLIDFSSYNLPLLEHPPGGLIPISDSQPQSSTREGPSRDLESFQSRQYRELKPYPDLSTFGSSSTSNSQSPSKHGKSTGKRRQRTPDETGETKRRRRRPHPCVRCKMYHEKVSHMHRGRLDIIDMV